MQVRGFTRIGLILINFTFTCHWCLLEKTAIFDDEVLDLHSMY